MRIVYGIHAVRALAQGKGRIRALHVFRNMKLRDEMRSLAESCGAQIVFSEREVLDALAGSRHHQGVVAEAEDRREYSERWFAERFAVLQHDAFLLALDSVEDPRNLGACVRTAAAAGVHALLLPKSRGTHMTPVAEKAASGAADVIPIVQVSNLVRRMEWLKQRGIQVVGAASDAEHPWSSVNFFEPTLIVLGSEGKGLRRLTREACDQLVSLPVLGGMGSLNLSVAAGILLYEVLRQRGAGE